MVAMIWMLTWLLVAPAASPGRIGYDARRTAQANVINVVPKTAHVYQGDQIQLVALDQAGKPWKYGVTWVTDQPGTAAVSQAGVVTALQCCQTALIIATLASENASDTARITVTNAPVGSIRIKPRDTLLVEGDTTRLQAIVTDTANDTLTGHFVRWAPATGLFAHVLVTGLVRADGRGIALISAETRRTTPSDTMKLRDSVQITVLSLAVKPDLVTVAVGGSVLDTAIILDPGGKAVTNWPVQWKSLDPGVATVSPAGQATGVAPGVTRIALQSYKSSGLVVRYSKTRVVPDTSDAGPDSTGECLNPPAAWLWCDTFETNRLARYFLYDSAQGSFRRVSGTGLNGSYAMKALFVSSRPNAGALMLGVGKMPAGFRSVGVDSMYRELYWRLYVRYDSNWMDGAGTRLTAATSLVNPLRAQAMSAFIWPGSLPPNDRYLYIDPATGTDRAGTVRTTRYNDFTDLRFLGSARVVDSTQLGRWYCLEAHARLNDSAQANGVFELWVDGVQQARKDSLAWVGAQYGSYGINAIILENAWRPRPLLLGAGQVRYLDDLVVSTARIGCHQ